MAEVATLDAARERQLAMEHKEKVSTALAPVIEAIQAARRDGFTVNFQLSDDAIGRTTVAHLCISKVF